MVVAVGGEFEGLAEEAQEVVPGVEGAVDVGGNPLLGGHEGVFENGFAGTGFTVDDAESALLGVDLGDVEVALLVFVTVYGDEVL